MCVIIYAPDGSIPSSELVEGLLANPDGWGYMFAQRRKIIIRKGLWPEDFWKSWKRDQATDTGPLVWHARIGTHGRRNVNNCHPFLLTAHHGLALAHNGVISGMPTHKQHSDTSQFVRRILDRLPVGFLSDPAIRELIRCAIGCSKLVFLDTQGTVDIIGEEKGFWSKGRWYSNTSCFPPPPQPKPKPVDRAAWQQYLFPVSGKL